MIDDEATEETKWEKCKQQRLEFIHSLCHPHNSIFSHFSILLIFHCSVVVNEMGDPEDVSDEVSEQEIEDWLKHFEQESEFSFLSLCLSVFLSSLCV